MKLYDVDTLRLHVENELKRVQILHGDAEIPSSCADFIVAYAINGLDPIDFAGYSAPDIETAYERWCEAADDWHAR
jgi:hypothetical protein